MNQRYNDVVADYYDFEADSFEKRAGENHVLMTLRDSFREITLSRNPRKMLEIGYGPGLDMTWFADRDEVEIVHGVDISPKFQSIVLRKSQERKDNKLFPRVGSAEEIRKIIGRSSVDTIFVYFGALNTVSDLGLVAKEFSKVLKPGGTATLTFVNRWYLFDILWNILLLRPKMAFARLKSGWSGYSPTRSLPSHCPSAREVIEAFRPHLRIVERRGYCIFHPAWYRKHWAPHGSMRSRCLYFLDRMIQFTPFWNIGEYSLYVFELPDNG